MGYRGSAFRMRNGVKREMRGCEMLTVKSEM